MTAGNIVTLGGVDLDEANKAVISELEYLLEKASAGDIDGIAYAVSYIEGSTSSNRKGVTSNSLIGSLGRIKAHLIAEMAEEC